MTARARSERRSSHGTGIGRFAGRQAVASAQAAVQHTAATSIPLHSAAARARPAPPPRRPTSPSATAMPAPPARRPPAHAADDQPRRPARAPTPRATRARAPRAGPGCVSRARHRRRSRAPCWPGGRPPRTAPTTAGRRATRAEVDTDADGDPQRQEPEADEVGDAPRTACATATGCRRTPSPMAAARAAGRSAPRRSDAASSTARPNAATQSASAGRELPGGERLVETTGRLSRFDRPVVRGADDDLRARHGSQRWRARRRRSAGRPAPEDRAERAGQDGDREAGAG